MYRLPNIPRLTISGELLDAEIEGQQRTIESYDLPSTHAVLRYTHVAIEEPHRKSITQKTLCVPYDEEATPRVIAWLAREGRACALNARVLTHACLTIGAAFLDGSSDTLALATFGMTWNGAHGFVARPLARAPEPEQPFDLKNAPLLRTPCRTPRQFDTMFLLTHLFATNRESFVGLETN